MNLPKHTTTCPVVSRRKFLGTLLALGVSPQLIAQTTGANTKHRDVLVSAQGRQPDEYSLAWVNKTSTNALKALSEFRGHDASQHPLRPASVLMYGRRPGNTCIEVNLETGTIDRSFQCKTDRHLFGHGCFSADGKTLFTSEANLKTGQGKVGIRDALNYQLLGEFDSHGIGPHEIKLIPDGKTLVVANGGILTHPDSGRKKLNLDTMQSSLTYLDLENGQQIDAFQVSEAKASIRHLDVASDGTVAFATQVQRGAAGHDRTVPLAGIHKPGHTLELLANPEPLIHQMKDYMGSAAINNHSRIAGFTSPRGNIAAFWHLDSGQFLAYHALHDVCGIAVSSDQEHFIVSNSTGQLRYLDALTLKENKKLRLQIPNTHWDNHLLVANVTATS